MVQYSDKIIVIQTIFQTFNKQIYVKKILLAKQILFLFKFDFLWNNFMVIRISLCLILLLPIFVSGQPKSINYNNSGSTKIVWQHPASIKISDSETQRFLSFTGAQYAFEDDFLPRCSQKISLAGNEQDFSSLIINPSFEVLSEAEAALIKNSSKIGIQIQTTSNVLKVKKKSYGVVSFIPIRKNPNTGKFEKLVSFDLLNTPGTSFKSGTRSVHTYAPNSVLQNGTWYKIAVYSNGIYKLSYSFLKNLGINMALVNPQNIRVYGNGGGMLPELNSTPRPDDLVENAIYFQDNNGNGIFDGDDYLLFYGKGTNTWSYNSSSCPKFSHAIHLYSDSAYYFINTDLGPGKRIQSQASSALPVTNSVSSFDDYSFHENENVNFIKSGRAWFGEYFENTTSFNFSFSFPNIDTSHATVKTNIASRYLTAGNALYSVSSQSGSTSISIPSVSGSEYDAYANIVSACYSFLPTSPVITVNVTKQTTDAVAWLDYIEVNARRQLIMAGTQMAFRDAQSVGAGKTAQYNVTSTVPIQIWDITDISNVKLQTLVSPLPSAYQFTLPSDSLKQFIAFTGSAFNTPYSSGIIVNQNLHSLSNKDLIIIAHPDFLQQANQLAAHHQSHDNLSTIVVTPQQIYNEFSSGEQDISAIRDFVKMFYDKASGPADMPKYLLLFGDGSYDNKKRFNSNTNFIPTYQSYNSTIVTSSYVSDDFYGLLDDGEGLWINDAVDIGIGRFPVDTKADAQAAVNKIINYTRTGVPVSGNSSNSCSNKASGTPFGDWRNMICFIGDDEDGDIHVSQANQEATMVDTTYNNLNIDKIYLDAFQQEATPGGDRYPGVTDAINNRVQQGALIINYTGHGGVFGFAHERIIEVAGINKWNNADKLFLLFTATCEFSRFDDPEQVSAGEYTFLNPNGAAIALFSTVRLVFASPNFYLNLDFYKAAFVPVNGKMPRLGDLYEFIKTQPGGNSENSRNFTLLGDPALTLTYPKNIVSTDSVNFSAVTPSSLDTLKALSVVTISGHLKDNSGNTLNTFNGVLYPTVYDKSQNITTLSNDGVAASPPFTFKVQKNILYKGKVSVSNGHFKFSFIVPKDIAYQYGIGRISYYAENGNDDASGYYEKVIIGGSSNSAASDVTGPEIKLYLNDAKFVFGGLTDEKPDLYSVLKDASGINTVGNGIGHDIIAVLDGNTSNSIVLNDFYQSDLNSYKSGSIRYPFADLNEGKHTLKLKVWDVYNNSSESYTEFIVSKSATLALSHVLNYPNPFTTKTQFYFEDNQCCQVLEVQVQVFTVSGKLVKNIDQFVNSVGFRSDPIDWDGRDDFGDKIGRGVYIYRVKIKTSDGSTAEKYEKLVILN